MSETREDVDITILARLEALLFASRRGVSLAELARALELDTEEVEKSLKVLKKRYAADDHGVELREFGGRWRFYVKPGHLEYVSRIRRVYAKKLSPSQLEVLAAVAIKGEATRAEVERMRMKESSAQLRDLVKLNLLNRKRRGRSFVYTLSAEFYEYFQLEDISELLSDNR